MKFQGPSIKTSAELASKSIREIEGRAAPAISPERAAENARAIRALMARRAERYA